MAVDVEDSQTTIETDTFDYLLDDLRGFFPSIDVASDEIRRLVETWGLFGEAIQPLVATVEDFVGERSDSVPEWVKRELSLVNEFTATGVWQGINAPTVQAVQEAEIVVFESLLRTTESDVQGVLEVISAVRILANGGVLDINPDKGTDS